MTKTKYKVDIFKLLNAITMGDSEFIRNISDDDLKSVSPVVVQQWLMGANNNSGGRMALMNEIANPYIFSVKNK